MNKGENNDNANDLYEALGIKKDFLKKMQQVLVRSISGAGDEEKVSDTMRFLVKWIDEQEDKSERDMKLMVAGLMISHVQEIIQEERQKMRMFNRLAGSMMGELMESLGMGKQKCVAFKTKEARDSFSKEVKILAERHAVNGNDYDVCGVGNQLIFANPESEEAFQKEFKTLESKYVSMGEAEGEAEGDGCSVSSKPEAKA